jgi:hypothetical protein
MFGHFSPATSAAFKYSETVAWPTAQLAAIWRWDNPRE